MILRPVDASGDILPVLSSSAMLSGPETVAQLVRYRLSLLRGEWWENPEWGFFALEALQASRLTEVETAAVSAQISAYIRETSGVLEVENVQFTVSGRPFFDTCSVQTGEGSAQIRFETGPPGSKKPALLRR